MQNMPDSPVTPVTPFQPLSKADVARVLDVCVRTVEGWVNSGEMPPPAKIGARVYWHPGVFYAWLDKRLQVAETPAASDATPSETPNVVNTKALTPSRPKPRAAPKSSAATRAVERSERFLAELNGD